MRLTSIRIHPVKSTRILSVSSAQVSLAGLAGDREWMLVDGHGELVSARTEPSLFQVTSTPMESGIRLEAEGLEPLECAHPTAGHRDVSMFSRKQLRGRPVGPEADVWFRRHLGRDDVSLIWCDDPTRRQVGKVPGDHAAFQDGYPVTVMSAESMAQLNEWIIDGGGDPVTIDRFRPNLVIEGAAHAFAEDDWQRLRVGEVELRRAKLVARCAMTLVDPRDLSKGKDPLRTLARHRRWDGSTWCAVHFIPMTTGTIFVGDNATSTQEFRQDS